MQPEQIKERIKLKTEFLKFYFFAVIGLITGIVTLALKESRNLLIEVLIVVSTLTLISFIAVIIIVSVQIKRLIAKLP